MYNPEPVHFNHSQKHYYHIITINLQLLKQIHDIKVSLKSQHTCTYESVDHVDD